MTKVTVKTVPTSHRGLAAEVVAVPEAAGAAELTKPTLTEGPPAPLGKGMFPVRILKGYRPLGDFVMRPRADPTNEFSPRIVREPTVEERAKVRAGLYCSLPLDEAKSVIARGAAVRDDEMKVE